LECSSGSVTFRLFVVLVGLAKSAYLRTGGHQAAVSAEVGTHSSWGIIYMWWSSGCAVSLVVCKSLSGTFV
jgi:hypothetical protein